VRDVIASVERVTGRTVAWKMAPRRPGDPAVLYARADKARAELRWQPRFTEIDAIVRTAWNWHHTHPHGYGAAAHR
jgi:UDP-glucose 4-epimerase